MWLSAKCRKEPRDPHARREYPILFWCRGRADHDLNMNELSSNAREASPLDVGARVRLITAASLFDGHDASININRRILIASGADVIHLGHNRLVDEIVTVAIQEDAHGVALSS